MVLGGSDDLAVILSQESNLCFVLKVEAEGQHSAQHEALLSPDGAEFVHHGLFVIAEFPPVISLMQVHSLALFGCESTVYSAKNQDIHR